MAAATFEKEWQVVLDDQFYQPSQQALDFYQKETGIKDEVELKQHILTVQKEAFSVSRFFAIEV
jgi:hypothetical protein